MPESLIRVGIPLYNARDVIRETIESVLAQTFRGYEIIVIVDGSTDASGDVIRSYGERIRYIRQPNGGVAQARNRGISAARGGSTAPAWMITSYGRGSPP